MSGRSEREKRRQERLESEQSEAGSDRNRLVVGYAIAAAAVLAVVVLVIVLVTGGDDAGAKGDSHINLNAAVGSTNGVKPDNRAGTPPPPVKVDDLDEAAEQAGCDLRLKLPDEGNQHIPAKSPSPGYGTNPPTSGPHVEPPYQQADGAYSQMPSEINIVHTLEHGRMEIQYSPDLSKRDQLALKGLYDTMYGATLLFPNDKMPYDVAATTWTNLIGCPTYKGSITLDAIRAFGKDTWGRYGGEPAEAFEFTGPTPVSPDE
ncbi:MAG TPA: DUF3105 domain-containing protein [Solirubrobacterales bacterium]|nr:DUF3105 domain-containing protein [Solirubrobacterales bacterium]